jgi:hypothetical protein
VQALVFNTDSLGPSTILAQLAILLRSAGLQDASAGGAPLLGHLHVVLRRYTGALPAEAWYGEIFKEETEVDEDTGTRNDIRRRARLPSAASACIQSPTLRRPL